MKFDKTKGGWKYNRSGVMPCDKFDQVEIRDRDGRHYTGTADSLRWVKGGRDSDIIYYRKARPAKQPAPIEIMQPGELQTDIGKYDAPRRRRMPPMWMAVVALVLVAVILAMVVA
jgi:hypothetical protein